MKYEGNFRNPKTGGSVELWSIDKDRTTFQDVLGEKFEKADNYAKDYFTNGALKLRPVKR